MKVNYNWNEETGLCSCTIFLNDFLQGFGIAECAPEDRDVISEITGREIAYNRAQINLLQNYKNRELRPGLKALLHLKGTMVRSKHYEPDSYESKRLNIEIRNYEKDIAEIQAVIDQQKQHLYDYINLKDKFYKGFRKHGKQNYTDTDSDMLVHDIDIYERLVKNENKT